MKRILLTSLFGLGVAAVLALPAQAQIVNAQTGTTYTVVNTDCGKLITVNNVAGTAITLPQPSSPAGGGSASGQFMPGCTVAFSNLSPIQGTITPTSSTIDGAASMLLPAGQGPVAFASTGTGWTKAIYAGAGLANANLLDNGDFAIDQRNEGAAQTYTTTTAAMSVDRWQVLWTASTTNLTPSTQRATTATGLLVAPYEFKLTTSATVGTADVAATVLQMQQNIEGLNLADLQWGTANAQPVTYSFWIKTSVAGTWGVSLQNAALTRAYVTNCATLAATWTYCSGVIPGPTTGTWNRSVNNIGGIFGLAFDCGANTTAALPNTWNTTTVNTVCNTSGTLTFNVSATAEVTGVKLERGTVPTAFVSDPVAVGMVKARHFYRKSFNPGTAPAQNAGTGTGEVCNYTTIATSRPNAFVAFDPPMYHASWTVTQYNPAAANNYWRDETGSADVGSAGTAVASDTGLVLGAQSTISTIASKGCIHYTVDSLL